MDGFSIEQVTTVTVIDFDKKILYSAITAFAAFLLLCFIGICVKLLLTYVSTAWNTHLPSMAWEWFEIMFLFFIYFILIFNTDIVILFQFERLERMIQRNDIHKVFNSIYSRVLRDIGKKRIMKRQIGNCLIFSWAEEAEGRVEDAARCLHQRRHRQPQPRPGNWRAGRTATLWEEVRVSEGQSHIWWVID